MISHEEFSRLRLRDFCGGDELYTEDDDEHGDFICESIRGIVFGRPVASSEETFMMDIDLLDYSTDAGPAILARLGLPLTRNSTSGEVIELLGKPASVSSHGPDDRNFHYESFEFEVGGELGYSIACTFLEPGAQDCLPCYQVSSRSLWGIKIHRTDLDLYVTEDVGGGQAEYLETVEIEPQDVGAPGCFVEDVTLLTQPTSRDRIGVNVFYRLSAGMENPRLKLLIVNSAGAETTMIWLADSVDDEDRHMLIFCLDRNLLPNSVIEFMIEEQDGTVVQTYQLRLGKFRIR